MFEDMSRLLRDCCSRWKWWFGDLECISFGAWWMRQCAVERSGSMLMLMAFMERVCHLVSCLSAGRRASWRYVEVDSMWMWMWAEQKRRTKWNDIFREGFLFDRERAEEKALVRYYSLSKRFQDHFAFAPNSQRLDSPSVHFRYTNYRSRSELFVHSSNSVYRTSIVPSPFHSGFVNFMSAMPWDREISFCIPTCLRKWYREGLIFSNFVFLLLET